MTTSNPHILIVDDDPSIREGLALALKDRYIVHCAATGDQARAILRKQPMAAIVLDAVLSAEHGLDLIERFRALSQAPILILTGYGTEELAIRALRAKAADYLKKPVNLDALRAALARLVQQAEFPQDPIARARRHLAEHPERQHTTASLAREVGLSERHIRRRFRETYGMTPRRYLTEIRLQRAMELLRTTQLGIEQIALQVGYPSVTWFDKVFKRAYSLTPSEFRAGQRPLRGHTPPLSSHPNG